MLTIHDQETNRPLAFCHVPFDRPLKEICHTIQETVPRGLMTFSHFILHTTQVQPEDLTSIGWKLMECKCKDTEFGAHVTVQLHVTMSKSYVEQHPQYREPKWKREWFDELNNSKTWHAEAVSMDSEDEPVVVMEDEHKQCEHHEWSPKLFLEARMRKCMPDLYEQKYHIVLVCYNVFVKPCNC